MKIAIYGYGNIGKGTELAIRQNPDMELSGIFTRRDPAAVKTLTGAPVYPVSELSARKDDIDVLIICAGSATDLPELTPALAKEFCVIDSFDTHARIPEHFAAVDKAAKEGGNLALISCGWDPGMFSLARLYSNCILPEGADYTFWGRGVSQGHSDAIRHIEGVLDARQYTVPKEEAVAAVKSGTCPVLTTREKHLRECYVVAAPDADRDEITRKIKEMPNYFADYDTTVTFITAEEMKRDHSELPHGGKVIRSGKTGLEKEHSHTVEYSLTLDSNPEFTSSCIAAFARALWKMRSRGITGCITVFDVAPADLSPLSAEEIRSHLL